MRGIKIDTKDASKKALKELLPRAISFIFLLMVYTYLNSRYGFEYTLIIILTGLTVTVSTGLNKLNKKGIK